MAEIVDFPSRTVASLQNKRRDIEPRAVAEGLEEHVDSLAMLLVIGVDTEGRLYAASSSLDTGDNVLLLERMKRKLLSAYGVDEFR